MTTPTSNPVPLPIPRLRSTALAGRDGLSTSRPEWAYACRATGESLRGITAEALELPTTPAARERLRLLDRAPEVVVWGPEHDAMRDEGAAIRRSTLADLEAHLAQLTTSVQARGGVVHRAATAADARALISHIARDNDVELITKAKSMATEEIHLNDHLENEGFEVVETDLGEYIVQLRRERPSQLVGPALHLSTQDVAELFSGLGEAVPAEADPLAAFARARLREDFRAADMGITGVNFAAADTGTLCLVTNEGNVDMVTTHPRIHVAIMGMDKVIQHLSEIGTLVPLLCYAASDKRVTAYQTLITGPRQPGEVDGPEQLHLIILDNGRSTMLGTPLAEALACIRCGNCQMVCPVYQALGGGHAYGSVYAGPIGAVISPSLGDPDEDGDLPFLSSLCGACFDACPVRIPLPDLLVHQRARYQAKRHGPKALVERTGWAVWSHLWSRPALYRATIEAARVAGKVVPARVMGALPLARAWTAGRALPALRQAGVWRRENSADKESRWTT